MSALATYGPNTIHINEAEEAAATSTEEVRSRGDSATTFVKEVRNYKALTKISASLTFLPIKKYMRIYK